MQIRAGRRLVIAGAILIVVGMTAAAAAHPSLGGPIALLADPVFWPIDGLPGVSSDPVARLYAAVAGGLMVGWGMMFVGLGRGWSVGRAIATGAIGWFTVDSAGSVVAGAPLNVVGNVGFLALTIWAAWPSIDGSERRSSGAAADVAAAR